MKNVITKYLIAVSIAFMSMGAFAQTDDVRVNWLDGENFLGGNMINVSSNGRYAVGHIMQVHSYIWDSTTGEIKIIPRTEAGFCEAEDVSNNGVVAGIFANPEYMESGNAIATAGFYMNERWIALPGVKGVSVSDFSKPYAKGITDDGTIIAGFVPKTAIVNSACTWTNGTLDPLFDGTEFGLGAAAYSISGDGKVLCGVAYNDDGQGPAVWNKAWTPNVKRLANSGYGMCVSPNGKYVTGNVMDEGVYKAFLWSEEKGMVKLPALDGALPNAMGQSVSDDGTVIGYMQGRTIADGRAPFIYKNGTTYGFEAYLSEFYGYTNESGNTLFTPMSISASGKTIVGWGETTEGKHIPWILTIGQENLTAVNDIEENNVNVWSNGNCIKIAQPSAERTNVEVIDMAGRIVKQFTMDNGECSIDMSRTGVYVVKIGNVAKKVMIK